MKHKVYNKSKDKHLTEDIQKQLQRAQVNGISIGTKTICSVVIKKFADITEESSKEEMFDAIEKVKAFCNVPLATEETSN